MVKARKFVLQHLFHGEPKPTDFKLVEEELPPLQDGGIRYVMFCFLAIVYVS
jgi:hypothetical protein